MTTPFQQEVTAELARAHAKHGSKVRNRLTSLGVLLEEYAEVEQCVWHDRPDCELLTELIQTAAMCERMAVDLYDFGSSSFQAHVCSGLYQRRTIDPANILNRHEGLMYILNGVEALKATIWGKLENRELTEALSYIAAMCQCMAEDLELIERPQS